MAPLPLGLPRRGRRRSPRRRGHPAHRSGPGLPQLVVPGTGDRTVNAEMLAGRGAGLAVPAERITAGDLQRLVADPALASCAREVAAEIASMPGPCELVEPLVELVR